MLLNAKITFFNRRIHITEETLQCLGADYKVEEGRGWERHPYLRDHHIQSWLIIPPDDAQEVHEVFEMIF